MQIGLSIHLTLMKPSGMLKLFLILESHLACNLKRRIRNLLTTTLKIRLLKIRLKESKPDHHFKDLMSYAFMFEIEPKMINEIITYNNWIIAMEEELH